MTDDITFTVEATPGGNFKVAWDQDGVPHYFLAKIEGDALVRVMGAAFNRDEPIIFVQTNHRSQAVQRKPAGGFTSTILAATRAIRHGQLATKARTAYEAHKVEIVRGLQKDKADHVRRALDACDIKVDVQVPDADQDVELAKLYDLIQGSL